jgi:hypothetical protein
MDDNSFLIQALALALVGLGLSFAWIWFLFRFSARDWGPPLPRPPAPPRALAGALETMKAESARWRYVRQFMQVLDLPKDHRDQPRWSLLIMDRALEEEAGVHTVRYTVEQLIDFAIEKKSREEARSG